MQVRNNVKMYRDQEEMTRADLARIAGITPETLDRIESGDTVPKIHTCLKISAALDKPVDRLFYLSIPDIEKLCGRRVAWESKAKPWLYE